MDLKEYACTDDALFHYTKLSVAIESILHTKKLKLSLLKDTNDPRENKFKSFNAIGNASSTVSPENSTEEISKKVNPILDRILRFESRVLCFCSNKKPTLILNDSRSVVDEHNCLEGWNKSRMWSQYGENHCGICLVFSKDSLETELKSKWHEIVDYKSGYVQYFQNGRMPRKATTIKCERAIIKGCEQYSRNHVIENSEEFFYQKHIDYRDEAEYRVVVFDPDGTREYLDISSSIKGVIAGDGTPKAYSPLINQLSEQLEIETRKVRWSGSNGTVHLGTLLQKSY